MCSHYLVPLRVGSTLNTGGLSDRLVGPDEGVQRAALTDSRPIDHVVTQWAGNAGGAGLSGAEGTAATLRGHASNNIGDVDGEDLCSISAVFSLLREERHK